MSQHVMAEEKLEADGHDHPEDSDRPCLPRRRKRPEACHPPDDEAEENDADESGDLMRCEIAHRRLVERFAYNSVDDCSNEQNEPAENVLGDMFVLVACVVVLCDQYPLK